MNEDQLTTRRQLELMQLLQQLADERARSEVALRSELSETLATVEKDYTLTVKRLTRQFADRRRELENEFATTKQAAGQESRIEAEQLESHHAAEQRKTEVDYKQLLLTVERTFKEKQWEALAVFDAEKDAPLEKRAQTKKRIATRAAQVASLLRDADTLLRMRKLADEGQRVRENHRTIRDEVSGTNGEELQQSSVAQLHRLVLNLQDQKLPSLLFEESRKIVWGILCTIVMSLICWPAGVPLLLIPLVGPLLGIALTFAIYRVLGPQAVRNTLNLYEEILQQVDRCQATQQAALQHAEQVCRQESAAIAARKDRDIEAADAERQRLLAEAEQKKLALAEKGLRAFETERMQLEVRKRESLAAVDEKYLPQLDELAHAREKAIAENENSYTQGKSDAQDRFDRGWDAMSTKWLGGFEQIAAELREMRAVCERWFPDWNELAWDQWKRPEKLPSVFRFGGCHLPLQAVKNGVSENPSLVPGETQLELPAWMCLGEAPRMVITTDARHKAEAAQLLQLMMLRFLTTVPAGKLRFTFIDPATLGENFATFMHLADYDEQLVGKRIWTDARQIDERLALVSDHMEKVLQKYLRNEFATIDEYNAQAGEVAEPYHVVVVANFPGGLTDTSLRRLQTIAATGPRCGVYTLMSVDTSLKLPAEFHLEEMLKNCVHVDMQGEEIRWRYPLFEKLPLQLDPLPPKEKLNELLRLAGEASRSASKVEVPFSVVAPAEEQMWQASSARELVVPIGRAGANELQSLRLGRGTAQHALISGKTGSGKSTLLHALVTNIALTYSPEELELYLVDFKKGVEFKTYATHELPHARIIAIESEREFGVSVLERLDQILRLRGERFRALGAQDLASYREAAGEALPRILLVIDEFQELFVADDKLAQDASLLLDRLVRQGRAFGIHVLLGSQTLGGAYSLARSTIGQMAVRIALECSEADAHLILSDDNPAARLLSRPGEAIYNDQNGMVDGNHLFQVVWLPDKERQEYLRAIRTRTEAAGIETEPAIVFEGNVPARPLDNEELCQVAADYGARVPEPRIWLGSAVRIEPPTQMTFRRQGGNHLLIVGQDEPLALGILTTAAAALAAQASARSPAVTILDGTRSESREVGTWKRVGDSLGETVEVCGLRDTGSVISRFADEVRRRGAEPDQAYEPQFLVIYDLAQFRDLRITEEEFSFSVSHSDNGKPSAIDKQFRELLKEGPAVGVHVLVWCDSHNSLSRVLDRLALREVDYRVALQMSPVDSTSLIDTPAAGRLGEHRAIFYRDDLGTITKFRPYGRPEDAWLAWLRQQAAQRSIKQKV